MNNLHDVVSQEQVEAEQAFAGAVLINGEFARQEVGWLDPDILMSPEIKDFWTRVRQGEDPLEVSFDLKIPAELLKWQGRVTSHLHIVKYANALVKKNYLRESILGAEMIVQHAQTGNEDGIQQVIARMATKNAGGTIKMRTPLEVALSLNKRIEKGNISIPWGIESLDIATRGKERGTLTVLAGRPSMGKSSLAFQCNEYQALVEHLKVGVFAVEMSGEQMFARRNCYKIDRMWMDVRAGLISKSDEESLKKYVHEYAEELEGYMYINDSTSTTSMDIVRTQLKENFDVIMIDHLGLLDDRRWKGERHDQFLGRITRTLHSLAKNTNCVILLLAQLNRRVEERADKRPTMSDLRDSGEIEQNADNVGLMYGEWYYDRQADNVTEVNFGKFRDGLMHNTAYVKFEKARQNFISLSQREIDDLSTEAMEAAANGEEPDDNLQLDIPF